MRRGIVISVAVILALCCLLSAAGGLAYLLWPRAAARPVVLIRSPGYGEQVEVGETVTVHSIARDEGKVARVEFWADGQLQESQTSALPGGTSPFPLLAHWQPPSPGTYTLTIRAFNAQGGRGHASVNVEAIEIADRDGDGVADDVDPCPDLPGPQAAGGCPDRDGDGIPDYIDACPDEAGLPEGDGCPVPSEGDRDGDGLLDEADACPDEPGSPLADGCPDADGDGVADAEDACPEEPGPHEHDGCPVPGDLDDDGIPDAEDDCPGEWGLPEHAGCPDDDGDGVRDVDDACPDEPGLPEHHGCPDRDGDGVPDTEDLCPDEPGLPENRGCPDTGAGDRDSDGILDDIDPCPEEWGTLEDDGCPPPGGGEDADDDGISDDLQPPEGPLDDVFDFFEPLPFGDDVRILVPVEFQALEFEVSGDYDEVYCYAGLAGEGMERYGPFEPLGERQWDIVEYLGGENSRLLAVPLGEPLEVHVECGGEAGILGRRYPVDLGSFIEYHDPSEWDRDITVPSDPGPEGDFFRVKYRICTDSCEEVELQPPHIWSQRIGSERWLIWSWIGDYSSIEGFRVYINDSQQFIVGNDTNTASIEDYAPSCGERYEFQVTAYAGDRESPRSNIEDWEGPPCPRTIRVTFDTLLVHSPPADEEGLHRPGPIYGDFWASAGAREARLEFDACWCYFGPGSTFWGWCEGLELVGREYSIQDDIFGWIRREIAECPWSGCTPESDYSAPNVNYVTVELGPREDLTIHGEIWDCDSRANPHDLLFEEQHTIDADTIRPDVITIHGHHVDLIVEIEVLPTGP